MKTMQEIAEEVRQKFKSKESIYVDVVFGEFSSSEQKVIPPPAGSHSSGVTSFSSRTQPIPFMMNTIIQWEIPVTLCPDCMSRLKGKVPVIKSAWTNPAKDSWVKKQNKTKYPSKPKVADDAEVTEVFNI